MIEQLYADYVKMARAYQRPLMTMDEFAKALKIMAELSTQDPMSTGILETEGMELIVMMDRKEVA